MNNPYVSHIFLTNHHYQVTGEADSAIEIHYKLRGMSPLVDMQTPAPCYQDPNCGPRDIFSRIPCGCPSNNQESTLH